MVDDERDDAAAEQEASANLSGTVPVDEHDDVVEGATRFVRALAANGALERVLMEVFERYLDTPADTSVARKLNFALNHVAGNQAGTFVLYFAGSSDPDAILATLADVDAPAADLESADRLLRRIQALFGYEAAQAVQAMDEDPDDWASATRKVYKDVLTSSWVIEIDITKYNGERLLLKMNPDTATRLVTGTLVALNAVSEDVFDREAVKQLFDQIVELLAKYDATISFPEGTEMTGSAAEMKGSDRLPELAGAGTGDTESGPAPFG